MNLLIMTSGKEPVIESFVIAQRLGIENKAVNQMLRKYSERFKNKGKVTFKMSPSASGQKRRYALLNEEQCIFLLTLSRNTDKVVEFKDQLSKAFVDARIKLALREQGKEYRCLCTDAIKRLVEYASVNGSGNADRYYSTFTQMISKALFGSTVVDKSTLNQHELSSLMSAESIANKVINSMLDTCPDIDYHNVYPAVKTAIEDLAKCLMHLGGDDELLSIQK